MDNVEMNPRLRVAPVPVEVQGKKMLLFQDPDQITEQTVLMPAEAAVFLQFFDGTRSLREIQAELTRLSGGQIVDTKIIEDIIGELDEHLLLESPRYFDHVSRLSEAWMKDPVRPPYLAGEGYPDDPKQLTEFLDACYTSPDGPGPLPAQNSATDLKAIIAPHLDLNESGPVIAHAFHKLAERTAASLFVIFGVGHKEAERIFVPSNKDYATPLGVAHTDQDLVESVFRRRKNRSPLSDYVHKQEHSIEFMVLFLQHALAGRRDFRILPVLVSGMTANLIAQAPPGPDPAYREFIDALKDALAERGEPVCFIGGVDLAHLGPRYGHQERWAPIRMAEEEQNDRRMLGPLLQGDREAYFQVVAKDQNRRQVCGFPAIYALTDAADVKRGEYLKWSYWHDKQTQSVVSFVSMAFY
jgi:MEMO1 family protein